MDRAEDDALGVSRLLGHLRDLVEDSDVPRREIDRRLGYSEGYLSQLLAGTVDLKFRHLIGILDAVGCRPQDFFARTFPRPRPRPGPETERWTVGLDKALAADRDVVGIYGFGIDAVRELRRRLERCEARLFGGRPKDPS